MALVCLKTNVCVSAAHLLPFHLILAQKCVASNLILQQVLGNIVVISKIFKSWRISINSLMSSFSTPPRLSLYCISFLPEELYMQYWFLASVCFIFSATLLWPKEAYLMIMSLSCLLGTTSQWWSFQLRWWRRWRSIRLPWGSFLRVEGNDVFYLREIIRAITCSYR